MSTGLPAATDVRDRSVRPHAAVLAAGAVLWRPAAGTGAGGAEVAVVHRPRYDDWSLPKGKVERRESLPATAVREVAEETGCAARLQYGLGDVHYTTTEGPKAVRFWTARATATPPFAAGEETDALRWLAPAEAAGLLSYAHERAVLQRFVATGTPTSVVLLVRHAKAGKREQWDGADADRPLSGTGRDQVARLTELLPAFGPDRIHSAPPRRCRDSVRPLAAALAGRGEPAADGRAGVDEHLVVDEPLLGEEGFRADPAAGHARFRELIASPGVTLLCSQGGVIPELIGAVAPRADPAPSKKAGTWVLALRGDRLLAADYYSRPTG